MTTNNCYQRGFERRCNDNMTNAYFIPTRFLQISNKKLICQS
jgi:hypothetical protein